MIFENEIIKLSHDNDIEYTNTIRVSVISKQPNTKIECSSNHDYIEYSYNGVDNVSVPIKKTCILYIRINNQDVYQVPFIVESINTVDSFIILGDIIQFEKPINNTVDSFLRTIEMNKINKDTYLIVRD